VTGLILCVDTVRHYRVVQVYTFVSTDFYFSISLFLREFFTLEFAIGSLLRVRHFSVFAPPFNIHSVYTCVITIVPPTIYVQNERVQFVLLALYFWGVYTASCEAVGNLRGH
jgi:hypothetical protein